LGFVQPDGQAVNLAEPNRLVSLGQSAQQHLLGSGLVTKVSGLQKPIAELLQSVVQLVYGGGELGFHAWQQKKVDNL